MSSLKYVMKRGKVPRKKKLKMRQAVMMPNIYKKIASIFKVFLKPTSTMFIQ